MDSRLQRDAIVREQAEISLSPSSLLIHFDSGQVQIPAANIIAIHLTDSEKVTDSQNRIRATVLIIGDIFKNQSDVHDDQEHSLELKKLDFQFTRHDHVPLPPLTLPHLPHHLLLPPGNGQAHIHVIISTLSGTQKAQRFFEKALSPLLQHLKISDYNVHRTESEHTISQLTRDIILPRANEGIKQLIILLSGDGGMFDIVNTLLGERMLRDDAAVPIVALIPMGTGNALFHSSCRPKPSTTKPLTEQNPNSPQPPSWDPSKDETHGLRTLLLGNPRSLPTLNTTFSPGSTSISHSPDSNNPTHTPLSPPTLHGCVLTSWALHASLVSLSDTPTHRLQGPSRFNSAAKSLLYPSDGSSTHLYRGVVSKLRLRPRRAMFPDFGIKNGGEDEEWVPRQERNGRERRLHSYVLVTMVSNLEESFTISPRSEPLDGKFRLLTVGAVGAEEVVRVLGLAYQGGKHVDESWKGWLEYEEVEGVRIDFEEEDDGDGDGDGKGRWRRVCVDGTVVECPRGGWVEVRKDRGRLGVQLLTLADTE